MLKNVYSLAFCLACTLSPAVMLAQSNGGQSYNLLLQSGTVTPAANINSIRNVPALPASEIADGYYFRVIQFWKIPTEQQKKQILAAGIQLHQYLPHNAYIASLPLNLTPEALSQLGVRALVKLEAAQKLSPELLSQNYPAWALRENNKIELLVQYVPSLSAETAERMLLEKQMQVVSHTVYPQVIKVMVPLTGIEQLASLPFVVFIESIEGEPYEDNLVERTSHRSNAIATDYPMGRHYNGQGVVVAMGDGGSINYHVDIKGRYSVNTTSAVSTHSEHVSGTIMGAGNKDPKGRGMAFGADIIAYQYGAAINAVPTSYTALGVRITSNSWSSGGQCNSIYNSAARQGDQQIRQMPSLMHVFSAGNTGADNCNYGAGSTWGNINGGYKQGKNVLAVANLTYTDAVAGSSSRGPARDGRIKPDISGVGTNVSSTVSPQSYTSMTGTSMSTPGVSGTLAQLYQAYTELNNGAAPDAGLLKAIVLNTADDIGNPGPDFIFGFGRINALRAVRVLEEQTYVIDTASQGSATTHQIVVPAGTKQLRAMVYWTDFEGANNAAIALVNDLNMQVTAPSGTTYNPWVLDHTPVAATLAAPATRGTDNLNNVEQVTLEEPAPGTYTINITGAAVPQGPQPYYIVYTLVTEAPVLTYPIGGEGIAAPGVETIRWDAYGDNGTFKLEYSADSGATWNTISNAVAATSRHQNWILPATLVTGQALVRVTRGNFSDTSKDVFTVIKTPTNISFAYICPDSLKLEWSPVAGAIGYEVSQLGQKYMDSVATTTATSVVIHGTNPAQSDWFSVKAIAPDNGRGRRAIAVEKPLGSLNCTPADAALTTITSPVSGCFTGANAQLCVTITNPGSTPVSDIQVSVSVNNGMPVLLPVPGTLAVGASLNHCFASGTVSLPASGPIQLSASVVLPLDINSANNMATANPVMVLPPAAAFTKTNTGLTYSFTATPVAGATYSWAFGDGNTSALASPMHTYAAAGTYTITLSVTDASGCTGITTQTVSVISGLFAEVNQQLSVHPNPTSGEVLLEWPFTEDGTLQLEVINLLGQVLHQETISGDKHRLTLHHLSEGTYLVKLKGKNQTAIARLVLQR